MLAVIPHKTQLTATRFDGGAIAVNVIAGERVPIIEILGKLGNAEQVED